MRQGEHTVQGARFDALIRRAFRVATGSLIASLLPIDARHATAAKRKKKRKRC